MNAQRLVRDQARRTGATQAAVSFWRSARPALSLATRAWWLDRSPTRWLQAAPHPPLAHIGQDITAHSSGKKCASFRTWNNIVRTRIATAISPDRMPLQRNLAPTGALQDEARDGNGGCLRAQHRRSA